ncbi:MAG TPA: ABC transporter ATP-binding protein [Candidatus Saccharimonadales bacterium]|nr:ABC transporter ATP-binding protein [Candidatus Saccharimonadales bacterium]
MKLRVENLEKCYNARKGITCALEPTSFSVADGEFVSLVGPSGCGKSTTLYMIAGLEQATAGEIALDDEPVCGPGRDRGMVFQNYTLFPWLTVLQNTQFCFELEQNRDYSLSSSQVSSRIGRAYYLLDLMGLTQFYNAYPRELSGGMKQRVAIARALVNKPKVLLMDEPFGALDAQTREEMQELLLLLSRYEKITTLFVTHDVEEAIFLSTRILVFSGRPGKIIKTIQVPFGEERPLELKTSPEMLRLKQEIVQLLHPPGCQVLNRDSLLRRLTGRG